MNLIQKEGLSVSNLNDGIIIDIAQDFTRTVGARYRVHGEFSGQLFREEFLEKYFKVLDDDRVVTVILDGLAGYPTSFLDEAFGGIARLYGRERCLRKIKFIPGTKQKKLDFIMSRINKAD